MEEEDDGDGDGENDEQVAEDAVISHSGHSLTAIAGDRHRGFCWPASAGTRWNGGSGARILQSEKTDKGRVGCRDGGRLAVLAKVSTVG
jgi:hypothetical protein